MHQVLTVLTCAFTFANALLEIPELKRLRRDSLFYMNATSASTTPMGPSPVSILSPTSAIPYSLTSQVSCLGSITYWNSIPPTIYSTITESFLVTVSASNASLPPAVLSTPPVACTATVIPLALTSSQTYLIAETGALSSRPACPFGACDPGMTATSAMGPTFQPALTVVTWPLISGPPSSSKPGIVPGIATTDEPGASAPSKSHIVPGIPTVNGPQISQAPEVPTGSAFTSTVFVTKKTPVPVVVPPTSAPPVFQIPSTTKNPITSPTATVVGFSPVPAFSSPTQDGATSKAAGSTAPVESHPPPASQPGNTVPSPINSPARPSGSGASNIPAQGPGPVSPAPTVATIDRVPVQVLPSSVVIGGQVLSIPASSSKTTVQVNGQTFTVQNSQIIAPGTTYAIIPEMYQEGSATALPSLVTAEGLTISVGASRAIIAGTTYAIGSGAGSSSTIRVGTKTVVLGSSGVILPSTTILPAEITAAPIASDLEVVTAAGLTFTIGPSLAIISGSTYTIGPGAKPTSIVVSGKTISVGSNGIGLASTTIVPEPNFSVMTVGSLTVSIDSSEAVIEGTTYHIGKGAPTETAVMNGKTISLGPSGVGLPSTTIPPETRAAPKSTETSRGGSALLSINMWLVLLALFVCFRTVSV